MFCDWTEVSATTQWLLLAVVGLNLGFFALAVVRQIGALGFFFFFPSQTHQHEILFLSSLVSTVAPRLATMADDEEGM